MSLQAMQMTVPLSAPREPQGLEGHLLLRLLLLLHLPALPLLQQQLPRAAPPLLLPLRLLALLARAWVTLLASPAMEETTAGGAAKHQQQEEGELLCLQPLQPLAAPPLLLV